MKAASMLIDEIDRRRAAKPAPPGINIPDGEGKTNRLDPETLETKMMLMPFVNKLEFIDIHLASRSKWGESREIEDTGSPASRAPEECGTSRKVVEMPKCLVSCLKSKYGLHALVQAAGYELLEALDTYLEDGLLRAMCDPDGIIERPTNYHSSSAALTRVLNTSTATEKLRTGFEVIVESVSARAAVTRGILADLETFSVFLRELRSEEDLLFYLHARKTVQVVCNLEPGLRGPGPHRSCQRLPAGRVVQVPHPVFTDGSYFPLLSIGAVRAVLRALLRTKQHIDTELKSVEHREKLVKFVVESKLRHHFVRIEGLTVVLASNQDTSMRSASSPRAKRGQRNGCTTESNRTVHQESEAASKNEDEFYQHWISIPVLLWTLIEDFRQTEYNIIRSLRTSGVDPESEDRCQGLLSINRLMESLAQDRNRDQLKEKLRWEEVQLTAAADKVQQLRIAASSALSGEERIARKAALIVAENKCKIQQIAVRQARAAVDASASRSDQIWTDVMQRDTRTYRKRQREMRGEWRGGANRATDFALKRYAVWVETQWERQKKEAHRQDIVQSLIKSHAQQLHELRLRSARLIQRVYREQLSLRCARNVAMAEVRRRRRERDERRRRENAAATRIANLRRMLMARRELVLRRKMKRRRDRKAAFKQRMARKAEARRRFAKHLDDLKRRAFRCWTVLVLCGKARRNRLRDVAFEVFKRWHGYAVLFARERKAAIRIQCRVRAFRATKRMHQLTTVERKFRSILERQLSSRLMTWRRYARNERVVREFRVVTRSRIVKRSFLCWTMFEEYLRDCRRRGALIITAFVRGGLARMHARKLRATLRIQKWTRSIRERSLAAVALARRRRNRYIARKFLHNLRLRHAKRALISWHGYAERIRLAKRMAARNIGRLEHRYFIRWHDIASKRRKRKERAALRIQRVFRGNLSRNFFLEFRLQMWAARTAQRMWRGLKGRRELARRKKLSRSATIVQARFRGIKGRERHRRLRIQWVLSSAEKGDFEMMRWHLECGRGFLVSDEGTTALMAASRAASKRVVKLCLRWGFKCDDVDRMGRNALHYASASPVPGADHVVLYLLLHGARDLLDVRDWEGYTPLLSAARAGVVPTVRILREAGASMNGPDGTGMNLLHVAVASGRLNVLCMVLEHSSFYGSNSPEEVIEIANEEDNQKLTPCHYACCVGFPKILWTLADLGVNINSADAQGRTLLHYAVCSRKPLCVEMLLSVNADPSIKDAESLSPLHHAALNNYDVEIVALCKSERTNVDQCDMRGETALHMAAEFGHALAVKELCGSTADPSRPNPDGDTPLHIAAANGHVAICKILLDYDADPNARNFEGKTPLGLARVNNRASVVDLFKEIFVEEKLNIMASDVTRDSDDWVKRRDDLTGETFFVNRSTKAETADASSIQDLFVKTRTRQVRLKRRVLFRPNVNQLSKTDYLDYYEEEKRKEVLMARKKRAAILFQREFRRSRARWSFRQRQVQMRYAAILQRKWRQHFARRRVQKMKVEDASARTIQRNWRNLMVLRCARRERRRRKRQERETRAAEAIQRRWRMKRARRELVKRRTARKLGSMTRSDWDKYMDRLTGHDRRPRRTWRAYEEWEAAELGLEETVYFYRNRINGNCTWEQPLAWARVDLKSKSDARQRRLRGFTDDEVEAARTLQSIWRGKVMREDFASLLKSVRIMRTCEKRYIDRPNSIIVLCNYMIYVLTIQQDREKARPLIEEAVRRMTKRGPDTPFILYTYGIYLAASGEEDWDVIHSLIDRAHAGDGTGRAYKLARKGFYRMATLILKGRQRAVAHFQYALCLQFCMRQYSSARTHYIKALELLSSEHRSREYARIVDNFNHLMQDLIGTEHDGIEEFNRHQEAIALKEAEEWNTRGRYEHYAVKIQSNIRVMLAKSRVKRVRESEEYRLRSKMKAVGHGGSNFNAARPRPNFERGPSQSSVTSQARNTVETPPGIVDAPPGIVGAPPGIVGAPPGVVDAPPGIVGAPPSVVDAPPGIVGAPPSVVDAPPGIVGAPPGIVGAPPRNVRAPPKTTRARQMLLSHDTSSHEFGKEESESDEDDAITLGWESCLDENGRTYYYNRTTGESQWTRPNSFLHAGPIWEECVDDDGNRFFFNLSTNKSQWDRPSGVDDGAIRWLSKTIISADLRNDDEWETCIDDEGRTYYYNRTTHVSQWTSPYANESGEDLDEWEECIDDEGRTYFYNRLTSESQWERPLAAAASVSDGLYTEENGQGDWEECHDDAGKVYYYNRSTAESQWERPW
eukprot:g246.t1